MERTRVGGSATVEQLSSPPNPLSLRDEVYEKIGLLRDRQISPGEFLGDLQNWQHGEGTLLSLNGSKGVFGKEVLALGGILSVIKEEDDVVISTFSPNPLRGRLVLGLDNELVLADLRIERQTPGWRGRLRVLRGLEERVKPGDAQKLLDAFLHTEPPAIESSSQAA